MDEEGSPSRKGIDEGTGISILILIGLVVIGFFYAPRFFGGGISNGSPDPASWHVRSINLLMFCYASDHDGKYPVGKSSTEVFQKLLDEKYCDDPEIFYFAMPGKTKPTSKILKPDNVCWDVTIAVTDKDSDNLPMVFATGYKMIYAPGGSAIPLKPADVKIPGLYVAYKSNSSQWIKDDGLKDHIVQNVVSPAFTPVAGKTYQQLTPDGILPP